MPEPASPNAPALSDAHRQMLEVESGLSPATIEARGYRTVAGLEGSSELAELGFNAAQTRTAVRGDVLLVPLFDIAGAVVSHQIRPDVPRVLKGSPLKYETPAQRGNRVDFPPAGRELVADGTSPIWVTEGAKTADALAQAGAGVLMLAGVWGFMGRTAAGIGTSVVSDLYGVPVEGRTVYLAYDSDVVTKESVQAAERRLAEILGSRGAAVLVVRIPAGENGAKVGADDYLAAGGTLEALIATAEPARAGDPMGGRPPQVFAYELAREGHEAALDATGAFLLRPVDNEGRPAGPARRYGREELRDRVVSMAGARGATTLPLTAAAHAIARLAGDHAEGRVSLAPAHVVAAGATTWVDMGTSIGHDVVAVSAAGWGYAPWAAVPHWIVREDHARELTPPAPTGRSWEPLRELVRLEDAEFAVIRLWLVSLLVAPRVPVLWWRGPAGSGKSTRAELVGRVLGLPRLTPAPRDKQDALSKLQSSPWISVENLGKLDPAISDLWCAAVTDGVIATRILYSDLQRWVEGRWTGQITSITDVPGALDDLLSRSLVIDVPILTERTSEARLHAELTEHVAAIRGALFDDAVAVLTALAGWDGRADGYRFPVLTAIAAALDDLAGGGHAAALVDAGRSAVAERSETDPWVAWLVDQARERGGAWEATASEIFDAQRSHRRVVTVDLHDEDQWPTSAKQVGRWLPARAGRLHELGVSWRKHRRGDSAGTKIHALSVQNYPDLSSVVSDVSAILVGETTDDETAGQQGSSDVLSILSFPPTLREREKEVGREKEEKNSTCKGGVGEPNARRPERQSTPSELPFSSVVSSVVSDPGAGNDRSWRTARTGETAPVDLDQARVAVIEAVRAEGALTVDVETSGFPVGHQDHQLRTVQLGGAQTAVVLDVRDPDAPGRALARDFLVAAPRLQAHSATADLVPLVAAGLATEAAWERMYDTVIPAKLADPTSTGADPGLKKLSGAVLGDSAVSPAADAERKKLFTARKWKTNTDLTTPVERSGWAQVDPADPVMLRYAAADVLDCAAIAAKLPTLPAEVIERERRVQRVTARVAHRGLRVDGERVARLLAEHTAARDEAAVRVRGFGVDNPGSDRQVAAALTEHGVALPRTPPSTRYPEGQPSVAASVLETLRGSPGAPGGSTALSAPARALVEAVLTHRHHDTVVGTFLEPYHQLTVRGDGRARPTVYTLGTDTGRMSCVRPNLQQLPREGGIRACITADDGHLLISADFQGVELRVAAALSGDHQLARMIAEGVDLHWEIARQVFGSGASKADRYAVKRGVFGHIYGGGIPTLARQVGVAESIMASAIEVLAAMTPGLAAWSDLIRRAVRAGQTEFPTYAGRIIHFPRQYPHKAPNYAIQGTARELLVDALERWEQTRWTGGVILPVHDEIVAPVPAADAAAATTALVEAMTTELYGVPIAAEASEPSFAWQDAV